MGTVQFPDEKSYHTWHDAKCAELKIPHPGFVDGELALGNQWTVAWVEPQKIDGQLCVTLTDDEIADDKTLVALPAVDTVGKQLAKSDVVFEKPLPAKWTHEGVEYDVPPRVTAEEEVADARHV